MGNLRMTKLTFEQANALVSIDPHEAMKGPWSFKPAFTPAEMLKLGVFGNNYFGGAHASNSDFEGLLPEIAEAAATYGTLGRNSWKSNCFLVKAGMDYDWWKAKGLIYPEDPLGWFHWYCRYYSGRRHLRDNLQIARWQNFARWLVNGKNQFVREGKVSAVVLQSLLQWGYNPLACFDEGHTYQNVRPPIPMHERKD